MTYSTYKLKFVFPFPQPLVTTIYSWFLCFFRSHVSYDICLSLSDSLYSAPCLQGPSLLSQTAGFLSFYGWEIFHCVCMPHPYPLTWQCHLGPTAWLSCYNDMGVQKSFRSCFNFLWICIQSGTAGSLR